MSNRRVFLFCILVPVASSLLLCADEPTEIQSIDTQLESLEGELKNLRKDAFNNEMEAQPYMLESRKEYTESIQASEDDEKRILIVKEKIRLLKERKQALLNEPPK